MGMGSQNGEIVYLGLQERACRAIAMELAVKVALKTGGEQFDGEYVEQIANKIHNYIWWGKMEVKVR